MNVMGGVMKVTGGGEGPYVELSYGFSSNMTLSPRAARQLAARIYVAARAAERITATEGPEQRER